MATVTSLLVSLVFSLSIEVLVAFSISILTLPSTSDFAKTAWARTKLNNIEFGNNYPPSITKYYEAEKRFYYLIYSIE
jgi:hypothetical protein